MHRDRTEYPEVRQRIFSIDKTDRLLFLGSCFTENIGRVFAESPLSALVNPFGITFNPCGISRQIKSALTGMEPFDLNRKTDYHWVNLDYHSSISSPTSEGLNDLLRHSGDQVNQWYNHPDRKIVAVTAGTAWTWTIQGRPINNCHKFPAATFEKRLLEIEEIKASIRDLIAQMPDVAHWILTISPVRHLRQGFEGNMRSKARLIEAFHALADEIQCVSYFPAYEIFMDDLRDYRWTNSDLIHPNEQAVDYIYQKFSESYLNDEMVRMMRDLDSLRKLLLHRPNPDYPALINQHENRVQEKVAEFNAQYNLEYSPNKPRW